MYETYKFGEWAFYMSVKRQMVKKKIHNQSRMNKLLKMGKKSPEEIEIYRATREINKTHKKEQRLIGKMLGKEGAVSTHLDSYTQSFKSLINNLTDV